ncbi:MAG: hypothetical protein ACREU2_06070, partial [Steroidobacteraceae bacterium]
MTFSLRKWAQGALSRIRHLAARTPDATQPCDRASTSASTGTVEAAHPCRNVAIFVDIEAEAPQGAQQGFTSLGL